MSAARRIPAANARWRRVPAERLRRGAVLVMPGRGGEIRHAVNSVTVIDGRVYVCCGDGNSPVFTCGRLVEVEPAAGPR